MSERRPSPDALLHAAHEAGGRGRLKIFLGAAPGVGKTYEMLQNAGARQREGADVVVGIVETHGRADTMALVEGLELVPRRVLDYKGRVLDEMDLDAVLARRPALVLVDELAHTNAPGSRHPKRFLDVEELLEAGIDVHTTLNIQHVESLNDVVAQITRIRVRETVPDRIIDRADEIEVIDLTPGDLIRRLREGKIYLRRNAERALKHYFSPGNLTALRELALRRTAQRVDEQLLTHMQSHAIPGPWAAGERVLVCVSEDARSASLVRYAKRLADRLRGPWTALSIEGRRSLQLGEEERDRIADVLRLAEHLGGEAVAIPGVARRIADDVIAWARDNNVTHIIIGKSQRSRLFEILRGSVVHDLVRRSGHISVHVIAGEEGPSDPVRRAMPPARAGRSVEPVAIAIAALSVAVALGLGWLLRPLIGVESVDLVFLTAVVGIAVQFGLWPSLVAVGLSSLAYNFFFLPPLYTFTIADPTNVASLFVFTMVAVIVSNLAARARRQAVAAGARSRTTDALYSFSRKLAGCGTLDDVLWATAYQMASMLGARIVLLLPEDDTLAVAAGYPPEDRLDEADIAAARWAFGNDRPAGRGADTLPGARRLFIPMRTGRGTIGVVGLDTERPGPILTTEQRRLFAALSDQGALAIERVYLVEDLDRAKLAAETDRLRQALLTSISHDLKTPLAAILGSAGALRDLGASLAEADKAELLDTVIAESERLNRFIANLLDMTRLESGAVAPNLAPHDVGEIVGSALARASKILAGHRVEVALAADLPMLDLDAVLFEQILFNILDNAAKYAPAGSAIRLEGWREGAVLRLQVLDEGDGIPETDLEAMGGTITAGNRSDRAGAVFTLSMPVPTRPRHMDTDR
jgi:two-component system sensor histidine kinase KdpD